MKRLYRSTQDRMVSGVCGGLAEYFNIDPTLIRLIFVAFTFLSWGIGGIILYFISAIVIPEY
ncbi:MAG TPA: PspC domain-containing protein [Firmicutes bacterium]|nr:PspC domain-containing protein [Bacillota bacterium]